MKHVPLSIRRKTRPKMDGPLIVNRIAYDAFTDLEGVRYPEKATVWTMAELEAKAATRNTPAKAPKILIIDMRDAEDCDFWTEYRDFIDTYPEADVAPARYLREPGSFPDRYELHGSEIRVFPDSGIPRLGKDDKAAEVLTYPDAEMARKAFDELEVDPTYDRESSVRHCEAYDYQVARNRGDSRS